MQCAKKWFVGTIIITLCLLLFLSPFTKSSADSMVEFNKLDYFYPKIYCLPDSLPYLYFQIGNYVHLRSAETGLLVKVYELKKDERIIKFDEDSVLALDIYNHPGDKQTFRRFDIDSTIEEFSLSWEDTKISGDHIHSSQLFFINNEPIQVCLDFNRIKITETEEKQEYRLYAENKDDILWEKKAIDGVRYGFLKNQKPNSGVVVVSRSTGFGSDYEQTNLIIDLLSGEIIYSISGSFRIRKSVDWKHDFISLYSNPKDSDAIKIIDIRTGKVVYEPVSNYMPFFFEDHLWLTSRPEPGAYEYGESSPFKLKKVERDGTVSEEIEFAPKAFSGQFEYCQILSDNIAIITDRLHIRLFNFRTAQQLCVVPGNFNGVHLDDSVAVFNDDRRIFALDTLNFQKRWELESVRDYTVETIETNTQIFMGYSYADSAIDCTSRANESDCQVLRIKVVNKIDMSLEPYEYIIQPFSKGMDFTHPNPYGLVAVGNGYIKLLAPGNVLVYSVTASSGVKELIETDDPRYLLIKNEGNRNEFYYMKLDIKTGSVERVEKEN